VAARALSSKRRLLRNAGLRLSDLDGYGRGLLDLWARSQAKVELLDAHFAEVGFLDSAGEPRPPVAVYFTALNAAARTLAKLESHLSRTTDGAPLEALAAEGRRVRLAAVGDDAA
jgi:hypothetical protein